MMVMEMDGRIAQDSARPSCANASSVAPKEHEADSQAARRLAETAFVTLLKMKMLHPIALVFILVIAISKMKLIFLIMLQHLLIIDLEQEMK